MTDFSAETLYNFETITSNRLSPNGQHIVYAVQRVVRKTEKKPSDLWVVATDGQSAPRRFTWGDNVDTNPTWSPDGQSIAVASHKITIYSATPGRKYSGDAGATTAEGP